VVRADVPHVRMTLECDNPAALEIVRVTMEQVASVEPHEHAAELGAPGLRPVRGLTIGLLCLEYGSVGCPWPRIS
jgi:hypothetical protein